MLISDMMDAYRKGEYFSDDDVLKGYDHFSKLAELLTMSGREYRDIANWLYQVGTERGITEEV